ncbi:MULTISPECIES: hypothetical protein [unclassified Nodularia (in: cyanobacteria)]|uniref:hypothetical protein n=1 Tax=unclassified Nodularia (in: cyanobacteria) TaxID=2656917 RepID=UPI0018800014|nr:MULTISPECIES: hypothetical protein [unclassified Nodularia (in: cyanobacteria)]MBE9198780.1 hypothetical protein [Nodularia sp. LEGE 06071]MCC2695132.1 hypothetical protein [Nodularia sp. LEGE 04288]
MNLARVFKILPALLLSVLLLTTACTPEAPGRFDQVQQESTQQKRGQAVVETATEGGEFNKFFPAAGDGYERVFTQEKKGSALANLKKDGKTLAVLTVFDTSSTPETAANYSNSTTQIAGYPAREIGNTQTAVLVNNRYQVKVLSQDPSFTASDRAQWIEKFNLAGIATLK